MSQRDTSDIQRSEIEIVSEVPIGSGGFSVVYKGRYRNRYVAIKFMKNTVGTNYDSDLSVTYSVASETKKMMDMRHPCIIRTFGVIWSDLAIVMEYMSMGTLDHYIGNHPEMTWEQRHGCAKDIASGMEYLHASVDATTGKPKAIVLHQDLKTANTLLYKDKKDCLRAKISDFGLSEVFKKKPKTTFLKRVLPGSSSKIQPSEDEAKVKHIGGTRLYRAPELVHQASFTKPCDVYAYGVVLLELVAMLDPRDTKYSRRHIASMEIPCSRLQNLMITSLHEDPQLRPTFVTIVHELDSDEIAKAAIENINIPKSFFSQKA